MSRDRPLRPRLLIFGFVLLRLLLMRMLLNFEGESKFVDLDPELGVFRLVFHLFGFGAKNSGEEKTTKIRRRPIASKVELVLKQRRRFRRFRRFRRPRLFSSTCFSLLSPFFSPIPPSLSLNPSLPLSLSPPRVRCVGTGGRQHLPGSDTGLRHPIRSDRI